MTQVKICCISSITEAKLALTAGANILGLVGPMPTGPGILTVTAITEIMLALPSTITTWLLTSETSAEAIITQHQEVKTSGVQLVRSLELGEYAKIRSALPDVQLIQVIHVQNEDSIAAANAIAAQVDCILLDSGNPDKQELGGTGRTHNWDISRRIVEQLTVPVFLAGGLNPENVATAIQKVRPFGVDLCSGIRTNKKLDATKLNTFMRNI